jgi:hypothetical protein
MCLEKFPSDSEINEQLLQEEAQLLVHFQTTKEKESKIEINQKSELGLPTFQDLESDYGLYKRLQDIVFNDNHRF